MTISCGSDEKAGPEGGVHGFFSTVSDKKSLNRRVQAKKNAMDRSISPWRAVSVVQKVRKQPVANELGSSPPLPRPVVSWFFGGLVESLLQLQWFLCLFLYRTQAELSTPH